VTPLGSGPSAGPKPLTRPARLMKAPSAGHPLHMGEGVFAEALDSRAANRRSLPSAYCLSVSGAYVVLPVCAIRVSFVPSGLLTFWGLAKR
jgi:hypothetical protein